MTLCGVETVEQLRQIHESTIQGPTDAGLLDFHLDDPKMLNPSNWVLNR